MRFNDEPFVKGCHLTCDDSILLPRDDKCKELQKSHLSCRVSCSHFGQEADNVNRRIKNK